MAGVLRRIWQSFGIRTAEPRLALGIGRSTDAVNAHRRHPIKAAVKFMKPTVLRLSSWARKNKPRIIALTVAGAVLAGGVTYGLFKVSDAREARRIQNRAIKLRSLGFSNSAEQLAQIERVKDEKGKARYRKVGGKFDRLPDTAKLALADIARKSFNGVLSPETLARTMFTIDLYKDNPLGHAQKFENRAFEAEKFREKSPELSAEIERCGRVAAILYGYDRLLRASIESEAIKTAFE